MKSPRPLNWTVVGVSTLILNNFLYLKSYELQKNHVFPICNQDCSRNGCFNTSSSNQATLSDSGFMKKNPEPFGGNVVWKKGIDNEYQCRSIAHEDSYGSNGQTQETSHLNFSPKVFDPHIRKRLLSLTSLSSGHQPCIQQKPIECQDCRIEEMDTSGNHINMTTGMDSRYFKTFVFK